MGGRASERVGWGDEATIRGCKRTAAAFTGGGGGGLEGGKKSVVILFLSP